jgi:Uncharacterized protein conserved in bacteria (DUF2252)
VRVRRACRLCGRRVVADILLGWTSIQGRDYLVRQLADHKASIEIEDLKGEGLLQYARVCGEVLAKGHARSGDPCAVAGYLGSSGKFDAAMADFAIAYANQTAEDHQQLVAAIRSGKLKTDAVSTVLPAPKKHPSFRQRQSG